MTETTPPDPPVLSDGDCERLWRMLSEPSADGQLAALDRAVERMRAAEGKLAAIRETCLDIEPGCARGKFIAAVDRILAITGSEDETDG